ALDTVTAGPLTHARTATTLPALPSEVRLRAVKHRPERVT
ncbi:alkaline shock response membrane anchor protein AmaP, partial [Streptomyces griseorubens]